MILIGLQNAEAKYLKTRHNAGAMVVASLVVPKGVDGHEIFKFDKYTNSYVAPYTIGNIYLPNTYMNLSGESVSKIMKKEDASSKDLCVFFDDVTLPVGKYKISVGEGASSHNGIKSIIENLGGQNDFTRVRIGVGKVLEGGKIYEPGPDKLSDFVLGNLNGVEIAQIQSIAEKIISEVFR